MTLANKMISGIGWGLSGKIIGQGAAFLITLVLARLLSPEDFGVVAIVNVIISMASVFIDMGFGSSLVQKEIVHEDHYSAVFVVNTGVGLLLTGATIFISGSLARFYGNELLGSVAIATSPIFVISAIGSVGRTKLYREMNFAALNLSTIYGAVLGGVAGIAMALNKFGVWSLVAQTLVNAVTVAAYTYVRARWIPGVRFRLSCLKELWAYSSRIFVSTIIGVVFGQFDRLVIGKISSPSQLGFYHRAKSLESMIQGVLSESVLSAIFPTLSTLQNEEERYLSLTKKLFLISAYVTIFISGLLYLISKDLIILLFSDKWLSSVSYFRIIALGLFVYPLGALLNAVLAGKGYANHFLNLTLLRYAVLVPAYVVLYVIDTTAFLYAHVVFSLTSLLTSIWFVARVLKTSSVHFYSPLVQGLSICLPLVLVLSNLTSLGSENHLLSLVVMALVFSAAFLAASLLSKNAGLAALRDTVTSLWCRAHT